MIDFTFTNTSMLVNGEEIADYDEGADVINMARLSDSATHKNGADGRMAVNFSGKRAGEVRIRLLQGSNSSAYLSTFSLAQESGIFVPLFVQFKDPRGNDIGSGTQGYIPTPPPLVRGDGINTEEWRIIVERLDLLRGFTDDF